jgi:hypothetical protein
MEEIRYIMPVLLLTVVAIIGIGQIGRNTVYGCGLTDLSDRFGTGTSPYAQGQQDAIYDHGQGLVYNPNPQCCHSELYDEQFHNGYDSQ